MFYTVSSILVLVVQILGTFRDGRSQFSRLMRAQLAAAAALPHFSFFAFTHIPYPSRRRVARAGTMNPLAPAFTPGVQAAAELPASVDSGGAGCWHGGDTAKLVPGS